MQRQGLGRTSAVGVIFLVTGGVVVAIGLVTVPALIAQAQSLIQAAPGMQLHLASLLGRSHVLEPVAQAIRNANLQELLLPTSRQALSYSSDLVTAIGWALTTLALAFYILADPDTTQAALYGVVPRRFHVRLARIMLNLETIVGGYMRGQILTSGLMGVVIYVLLRLLDIKNPLPLAVFAGVTDVLPYIGGILAVIPLVAAAVPHGSVSVVVVIASVVVYQEIENRLILPRVYGRVLRLPAWLITIALLAGGELMGIVGALLGPAGDGRRENDSEGAAGRAPGGGDDRSRDQTARRTGRGSLQRAGGRSGRRDLGGNRARDRERGPARLLAIDRAKVPE